MQLHRDVDRIWGTTEMIDVIERTAADMSKRFPGRDRLQVEEISAKNGGDIDGHGSHENGLDVDLGYFKANGVEHNPAASGQHWAPSMVNGTQVFFKLRYSEKLGTFKISSPSLVVFPESLWIRT